MAHVTGHQERPDEDPVHKPVILEVYVIYDQEPWVQEQGSGNYPLHRWVLRPGDEPRSQSPSAGTYNSRHSTDSL